MNVEIGAEDALFPEKEYTVGQKGATFIDRLFYMSLCNVVFDILYQTIHGCK
jgi:hypothetical protein